MVTYSDYIGFSKAGATATLWLHDNSAIITFPQETPGGFGAAMRLPLDHQDFLGVIDSEVIIFDEFAYLALAEFTKICTTKGFVEFLCKNLYGQTEEPDEDGAPIDSLLFWHGTMSKKLALDERMTVWSHVVRRGVNGVKDLDELVQKLVMSHF